MKKERDSCSRKEYLRSLAESKESIEDVFVQKSGRCYQLLRRPENETHLQLCKWKGAEEGAGRGSIGWEGNEEEKEEK